VEETGRHKDAKAAAVNPVFFFFVPTNLVQELKALEACHLDTRRWQPEGRPHRSNSNNARRKGAKHTPANKAHTGGFQWAPCFGPLTPKDPGALLALATVRAGLHSKFI